MYKIFTPWRRLSVNTGYISKSASDCVYTGTILLVNYDSKKETIWRVTLAAIVLTLFNIIFSDLYKCDREMVVNRIIAVLALATTAF